MKDTGVALPHAGEVIRCNARLPMSSVISDCRPNSDRSKLFCNVVLLIALTASLSFAEPVDFATTIHPILVSRCLNCHIGAKAPAGLALGSRAEMIKGGANGPAVIPGDSEKSLMVRRILGQGGARMPLGSAPLSAEEIAAIRKWIDEGAKVNIAGSSALEFSLSLRPPAHGGINELMARYYEAHHIPPAKPVSDAVFARRVYLDIVGLLPNPEQLARFEQDSRPEKRSLLVDELLAQDQNYAENWITFWNDLLHNDQGVTYYGDRESISDWLLAALKNNMPYDQFVQKLLAPSAKRDPIGFVKGVTWRGTVSASQRPPLQAAQNSAQVFLGINLKCNSCHDSFISHWKLREAYSLASMFSDEPLEIVRCDKGTGQTAPPQFLFPELGSVDPKASLPERRAAAARMFTDRRNGLFSRTIVNRVWREFFGRGLVEPVDIMEGPAWNPELLDWLAQDFIDHGYNFKHLLKTILTSEPYQRPSVPSGQLRDAKYEFRGPWPRRITAEKFTDAIAEITGNWRIRVDAKPVPGTYAREWRFKANSLTRALGRPMREAAVTERLEESTTLQALELANGEILNTMLRDGAKRMLNQLEPAPSSLWDSGLLRMRARAMADIDVTGVQELHLLTVDVDSYDASRVIAGWFQGELIGPGGSTALAELRGSSPVEVRQLRPARKSLPKKDPGQTETLEPLGPPEQALTAKLPYEIVIKLPPGKYTRFRALVTVDDSCVDSEIMPAYRAFVFDQTPNLNRLVVANNAPPTAPQPAADTPEGLVRQIYLHALSREPAADEMRVALDLVKRNGRVSREGVQDLLWSIVMSPEFQFVL